VTLKADGTFEDSSKHFYYYSNADWQKIVQKNEASYREAKQNVTQRLTHFIAKWEKTNNGSITLTRGHEIKVIFHDRNQFHHTSEKYSWVFELTGQATEITTLKCEERKNELTVESNYLPAPKAAQSVTKETIMLRLKRSSP
jgi:Ni,Fe-hydrogenase I large subunit